MAPPCHTWSALLCSWRLPRYKGNCSCRNHPLWGVKSAVLVLGKLHLWEHPGSLYSLEALLGTLLTWFNSSHRMQVAVGVTSLLSLLCPSSPLLSSTGSSWWPGLSPLCGQICSLGQHYPWRRVLRAPPSVCPDNVSSVSICILYCRFGTSPLAWGCFGSGSPQVAKFRDYLFVFISRAQLGIADGREACDKVGPMPLGVFWVQTQRYGGWCLCRHFGCVLW